MTLMTVSSAAYVGPMLNGLDVVDTAGVVQLDGAAAALRLTKAQLAETAGLGRQAFQKTARRDGPKAQSRLREMLEILTRIQGWAGSPTQALAWYRAEPIPAFGGRTAESLVKTGQAGAVRDYLDHLATGGHA